jgi:o-succinylbenzoate---CoA ligase
MKQLIYSKIHPEFKLNGKHYSNDELSQLAYSFIKEGEEYQYECGNFLLEWLDQNEYIIAQTSGTTGNPKRLKTSKQAMVNSAIATGAFFDLKEQTNALCCLPMKYIAGKMMLVRAMVLGWNLDIVPPSSSPLKTIEKGYDFVAMVPLQAENSIEKLHLIKKLLIGGATVNQELAIKIIDSKCEAYESYSMTETVTHIALKRIGSTVFKTLPNVTLSLDDRGCLIIDAPLLNPNQIITNDLVDLISDTEFVWKGRVDNVVNSGGVKLFPEVIEEKLRSYINSRFFVGGIADEFLGEKLVLVIEGNPISLQEMLYNDLDKFERPKEVFFTPKFLETETGKIKRKEILTMLNAKNPA